MVSRRAGIQVAGLEAEVAKRDTMATGALLYMGAIRAAAMVEARRSSVQLSRKLWKLTEGRKAAGAATGIDVIRAKMQLKREHRLLLDGQNELKRAKLDLVRSMGIPNDTPIVLTDTLKLVAVEEQTVEEAVAAAFTHRIELQAQAQRYKVSELMLSAVNNEQIPSVDVRGDYGLVGQEFDERLATYSAGAFLSWPIYDGQRQGRISQSKSQLRQEEIRTKNLKHQIGIETRDASQTIELTRDGVLMAQEALGLAVEQLRLSQKAFSIGTLTHLEVISAQIRVADAREEAIEALFNFNAARINWMRAQGRLNELYRSPAQYTKTAIPQLSIGGGLFSSAKQMYEKAH